MIKLTNRLRGAAFVLSASIVSLLAGPAMANQIQVTYSLDPGATSAPIAIPGGNTPVSTSCVQNAVGYRGVGQATILRVVTNAPFFLEWVGLDIASAAISTGFSATPGTHIIYCDFSKLVDLQVESPNNIQIVNTSSIKMSGVINFVW